MGNPASDKRKRTEKRRKKYEDRLGPGVYLPREERLTFNAAVEKAAGEAAKAAEAAKAKHAAVKKEKAAAKKEKSEPKKEEPKK